MGCDEGVLGDGLPPDGHPMAEETAPGGLYGFISGLEFVGPQHVPPLPRDLVPIVMVPLTGDRPRHRDGPRRLPTMLHP